jgi:hypothetical protein
MKIKNVFRKDSTNFSFFPQLKYQILGSDESNVALVLWSNGRAKAGTVGAI